MDVILQVYRGNCKWLISQCELLQISLNFWSWTSVTQCHDQISPICRFNVSLFIFPIAFYFVYRLAHIELILMEEATYTTCTHNTHTTQITQKKMTFCSPRNKWHIKHFWQRGEPRLILAHKGLGLSWMLLLCSITITSLLFKCFLNT